MACPLCSGVCAGVDLAPLVAPELSWLWAAVAKAADRRGDESMTSGPTLTVTAPDSPAQRAAVAGLLGGRPLRAGRGVHVDLAALTAELTAVAPGLTPGVVAAHAARRRLAVRARERDARDAATATIIELLREGLVDAPPYLCLDADDVLDRLTRTGWVARVRNNPDPGALVKSAMAVLGRLPEDGTRVDRRSLVTSDPHALDSGALPSLVLAIMGASGVPARQAWSKLGVDIDDLLGGLIVTGVGPAGWVVPAGATFTLPPKELAGITWAAPESSTDWVFVTENPSVLSAAVETFREAPAGTMRAPRVMCTAGTPSRIECTAIGTLAAAGWQVAVRADFDVKGLAHVRALLETAPSAVPWRMFAVNYRALVGVGEPVLEVSSDSTPWDPELAVAMNDAGLPVFEEDLLPTLLTDIQSGRV